MSCGYESRTGRAEWFYRPAAPGAFKWALTFRDGDRVVQCEGMADSSWAARRAIRRAMRRANKGKP